MKVEDILACYRQDTRTGRLKDIVRNQNKARIRLGGLTGSSSAVVGAAVFEGNPFAHLFILPDKESAAYFLNDVENIFEEQNLPSEKKRIIFYPTSYKKAYEIEKTDNVNILLRTDVLNRLSGTRRKMIIVTYPEALSEKVIVGTRAVTSMPKGTVKEILWFASSITPTTLGFKLEKLNAVIALRELLTGGGVEGET